MNRSTKPVLEEFFEGEGTGTEPLACQTTLKFISERQGLKSCKKQKKEVFIQSHTRTLDRAQVSNKRQYQLAGTLALRWKAVTSMWEVVTNTHIFQEHSA